MLLRCSEMRLYSNVKPTMFVKGSSEHSGELRGECRVDKEDEQREPRQF